MMKRDLRRGVVMASALAAVTALPSLAAFDDGRIDVMTLPSNLVHTGAASYSDQQLASDIVAAVSADRAMSGVTLTVVVTDGRITLSGSAKDVAQAAGAERIARDVAGARQVDGRLDIQGG
jgi:osmotically-inducible protein OsmY